jgi:predicted TIM-barrel fold metal-dependent hydrolase
VDRRHFLYLASASLAAAASKTPVIDTHIHLFADDRKRFPFHPSGTYQPAPAPLEPYKAFVREAGIDHTVIVHPEPYQDDHSYLEYCFANEPSPNFFKGVCLFDPIRADTGDRMAELIKRNPGRIKALRIHTNREAGVAPTTTGPIRDRDLNDPMLRKNIGKAHDLGLGIQMHFIPLHAVEIAKLARDFPKTPFILDHLARSGFGTAEQYDKVLAMGKLGNVYMKFSGVGYSSKQDPPHADVRPLVRRTFDAFGPDRMIWGGLGQTLAQWKQAQAIFDTHLGFASEQDRAKIRGLTAAKLFGWT